MKRQIILCTVVVNLLLSGFTFIQSANAAEANLKAENLRCEYRVDPLGIDITNPRLTWTLDSDQRGQKQSAYQVIVASSIENLQQNQGDLWNSSKVQSEDSIAVEYNGTALVSYQDCFWKVRVWDKDGIDCGWSSPARWSMGLLKLSDWQARWIGYDPQEVEQTMPGAILNARWIWSDSNAQNGTAVADRYFRREIQISASWQVESAICYITADDAFELFVNGQSAISGQSHASLRTVDVAKYLHSGSNQLAIMGSNYGTSDNPAALLFSITVTSDSGNKLEILSDNQWKANTQEVSGWETEDFDDSSWANAYAFGKYGDSPWGSPTLQHLPPPRYLRKGCTLADKEIKKAYLYALALGNYEVFMNGQRVSNDYFSPGWTDYTKRVYYRTYDVSNVLQAGDNAIGAILADGWYAGYVGYARERNHYGKKIRFACQLYVEYEDGTTQIVASGADWKATLGPLRYADFLQGEYYDARSELSGWDSTGYNESNWQSVVIDTDEVSPVPQAAVSEPVVVYEEVSPISVAEPEPKTYIFNMGQNFAGFVRLKVSGATGQKIQLRHAERLNPDGTIYTTNLRSAAATDTYICKGEGVEIWQPYFTFHGFQYVELTGLDSIPSLDTITGLAVSSDTPVVGTFECSDKMVNKIQSNALWTQRMNFIDVPTDCPQRDERLGWTGDAQVYINTACYQTDVQAFFKKWITDLNDAQRADGQFPTVAPLKVSGGDGGPAWADAGVICPWTIYKMYGDKQIIANSYEPMKRFIAFCKNRCTSELLPPSSFHCFGDWVNINDNTPNEVIFMAYFGYSTNLLAQMAEALGKTADAAEYHQLFEQIKTSFNNAYVASDGKIHGDSQCAYVLAIAYDLLDADMQKLAAKHLIRRIREKNWHLSTGFVGTKDLMLALAKIDRNDIAYRLLHNETFPSWGFSIKNGATSIWERWNGWTPEDGFNDPGMNSFAHYSFGAVCQWMFENIGGIQPGSVGFKDIIIKPEPDNKITWANIEYKSIRGAIVTSWKHDGSDYECKVVIPAGTTAKVYIVTDNPDTVTESGVKASNSDGVSFISFDGKFAIYEVESGTYTFKSKVKWQVSTWNSDGDSGISVGKEYTHKVNLNTDESQVTIINNVVFENDENHQGDNWVLTGAPYSHTSSQSAIDGNSGGLLTDFFIRSPLS